MNISHSIHEAAAAILLELGVAPIKVNGDLAKAWIIAEKGFDGDGWQWNNPLNTTQPDKLAVNANSAGVKIYPSKEQGLYDTAKTLKNGYYPHLLTGLMEAKAEIFFAVPAELDTWGSGYFNVNRIYNQIK